MRSLRPGLWRDSLHVTCGLTVCTPESAPGPTLGNEYGKTLPLPLLLLLLLLQQHCDMLQRLVHSTWTELNWPATSRPSYTTCSLVMRVTVNVTTWLAAVKLGRLVLGQFVNWSLWARAQFSSVHFSSCAVRQNVYSPDPPQISQWSK